MADKTPNKPPKKPADRSKQTVSADMGKTDDKKAPKGRKGK